MTLSNRARGLLAVHRFVVDEQLDPVSWRRATRGEDGDAWLQSSGGLKVIWSVSEEADERVWLHVSASRPDRLPSYSDMSRVKALFVGDERTAYSVWARSSSHVNIHAHCLHLWCVLDGDEPLPDFTRGTGSI